MGLPSVKYEGLYRNPLKQVTKFFNTRHPEKYRIYNLCEERDYPEDGFHGRVRRFGFDDHNPPPLSLLVRLCNEASEFLTEDKKNVVAIHCKGGKGRTGVVTASILLKLVVVVVVVVVVVIVVIVLLALVVADVFAY